MNLIINNYEVDKFIALIKKYNLDRQALKLIEDVFDVIISAVFGVSFRVWWNNCYLIGKIECIFWLHSYCEKEKIPINFFRQPEVFSFIMQTKHFVEALGKQVQINNDKAFTKEWVVIMDQTDNHVLESINEPQINEYHYNFTHAKTIKQQQDIINGMWSQHFAKEKINMENYRKSNFNFTTLKRKVNAFARHPIEDEDRLSREKWGAWSEEEKKQELQELFWKMLIWRILNKKK